MHPGLSRRQPPAHPGPSDQGPQRRTQGVFEDVRKAGFVRVRVDGEMREVDEEIELDRYKMHTIEAVVDRLVVRKAPPPAAEPRCEDRAAWPTRWRRRCGWGMA
jgi:excinuclease UvrABC ATPase subunit